MANPLLPLSLAGVLVSGLGYGLIKSPENSPSQHLAINFEKQMADAKLWMIRNPATDDICLIEKTRRVSANTSIIALDPACQTVFGTTEQISGWQQDNLGNVAFANEQGFPVLEFQLSVNGDLISTAIENENLVLSPES